MNLIGKPSAFAVEFIGTPNPKTERMALNYHKTAEPWPLFQFQGTVYAHDQYVMSRAVAKLTGKKLGLRQ